MIKMMRAAAALTFTGAAVAALAGCPAGALPGGVMPSGGASGAPGTAACTRDTPAATPIKGNASQGGYNGQSLPAGYDTYTTEADVTAAIKKEDGGANWACFQKFYPGATTVYMQKKNG